MADPELPPEASRTPNATALDSTLLELRARLRQARDQRGGCPPWEELRSDLVPGGSRRPGREERQAHVAICPYCGEHVREWRKSLDYDADRLEAVERGVARGIADGAKGFMRSLGKALPGRAPHAPDEPRPARPVKAAPPRALSAREEREQLQSARKEPGQLQSAPLESVPLGRLLVVEMSNGREPPPAIFLCAQVLDADVALVDSIDELAGDPDLALVCGVILGGSRPPASWPDAVRHARALVPRRPVVLLATFGAEATPGARRALGDALCAESDSAERILLSLDPDLR